MLQTKGLLLSTPGTHGGIAGCIGDMAVGASGGRATGKRAKAEIRGPKSEGNPKTEGRKATAKVRNSRERAENASNGRGLEPCSTIGEIVRKRRGFPISQENDRIMAGQNHAEQGWYDCSRWASCASLRQLLQLAPESGFCREAGGLRERFRDPLAARWGNLTHHAS